MLSACVCNCPRTRRYVADHVNHRIRQIVASTGLVTTLAWHTMAAGVAVSPDGAKVRVASCMPASAPARTSTTRVRTQGSGRGCTRGAASWRAGSSVPIASRRRACAHDGSGVRHAGAPSVLGACECICQYTRRYSWGRDGKVNQIVVSTGAITRLAGRSGHGYQDGSSTSGSFGVTRFGDQLNFGGLTVSPDGAKV